MLLASELRRRGFVDDEIFDGTGLSWNSLVESERFVSFGQLSRLARRGMELTGEGWLGLDVGLSAQVSSHGPLGYAMVASPDVGQVLDLVQRYASRRLQIVSFAAEWLDDRVQLRIDDAIGLGDVGEYVTQYIIGALCLLLETVSGMPLPDTRIHLPYPAPDWSNKYATRLGDVSLCFDAPMTAIDVPKSFASTPCITADSAAFRQALRLLERA